MRRTRIKVTFNMLELFDNDDLVDAYIRNSFHFELILERHSAECHESWKGYIHWGWVKVHKFFLFIEFIVFWYSASASLCSRACLDFYENLGGHTWHLHLSSVKALSILLHVQQLFAVIESMSKYDITLRCLKWGAPDFGGYENSYSGISLLRSLEYHLRTHVTAT